MFIKEKEMSYKKMYQNLRIINKIGMNTRINRSFLNEVHKREPDYEISDSSNRTFGYLVNTSEMESKGWKNLGAGCRFNSDLYLIVSLMYFDLGSEVEDGIPTIYSIPVGGLTSKEVDLFLRENVLKGLDDEIIVNPL